MPVKLSEDSDTKENQAVKSGNEFHLPYLSKVSVTWVLYILTVSSCRVRFVHHRRATLFHFNFTCSLRQSKKIESCQLLDFKQLFSWMKLQTAYHISRMVCSQAKVSDFYMVLRVKEDVDRLQVPVNHTLKERRGPWVILNKASVMYNNSMFDKLVPNLLMDVSKAIQYLSE